MLRALETAAGGMRIQQLRVDNISHNLANSSTTGFKKSRLEFQDCCIYTPAIPRGKPILSIK